jgi:hypothetical protein
MSEFKTCLVVRLLPECPDIEQWQLVEQLVYSSDILGCDVVVPVNFITNFISFAQLNFMAHRPSTVHDFLYGCSAVDRETADKVLKEALECINSNGLLTDNIFEAVRIFGSSHRTAADENYTLRNNSKPTEA